MPTSQNQFFEWLVPARSRIQEETLRLYLICNTRFQEGLQNPQFDALAVALADNLVGMGFSLWRAVFQASEVVHPHSNLERGLLLLRRVIADNTITYMDEKNPWSFKYYLDNAFYRSLDIFRDFDMAGQGATLAPELIELKEKATGAPTSSPEHWDLVCSMFQMLVSELDRRTKNL